MVYSDAESGAQPYSLVKGADITLEGSGQNPFVPGNRVLSRERTFHLLVLPEGVDISATHESLRNVPATNVLTRPTDGRYHILANRVYNVYPGYNPGGAGGSSNTPFPTVRAIDYETGGPVDCSDLNDVPDPRLPTDMPSERAPSAGPTSLESGLPVPVGPTGNAGHEGAEYAPRLRVVEPGRAVGQPRPGRSKDIAASPRVASSRMTLR
jgi:hypothetical protein